MTDQLDFGVNWVKGFSVRRASVSMDTFKILYSNITSFFRLVNKRASYSSGIISLAHAPMNVTEFSIGSINCNPNNADRGRSTIRDT
jgi:hypothetical protein